MRQMFYFYTSDTQVKRKDDKLNNIFPLYFLVSSKTKENGWLNEQESFG